MYSSFVLVQVTALYPIMVFQTMGSGTIGFNLLVVSPSTFFFMLVNHNHEYFYSTIKRAFSILATSISSISHYLYYVFHHSCNNYFARDLIHYVDDDNRSTIFLVYHCHAWCYPLGYPFC